MENYTIEKLTIVDMTPLIISYFVDTINILVDCNESNKDILLV